MPDTDVEAAKAAAPPEHWELSAGSAAEVQLIFRPREWGIGLLLGGGGIALFGYGILGFLKNWVLDRAPILPAGVIVFLVLLGGLWFGVYVVSRSLFTTLTYSLMQDGLRARKKTLFRSTETFVAKDAILKILINYVQPRGSDTSGMKGTYTTLVVHTRTGVKTDTTNFALEGWTKEEADWVAPIIADWAGVGVRRIRNGED